MESLGFVFSVSAAAKPEEFPRKPLGLELSLNPVAMKGNMTANGQNGRVGDQPPDRELQPHRGPGVPGETAAAAQTVLLQGSEAAEVTDTPPHPPGQEPVGEEGRVEPPEDEQPPSLLKPSEEQAQHQLLPTALPLKQPLLAPSCAVVDHESVTLPAPAEHGSLDSSLQNTPSPPSSSTTELSAVDRAALQQPNPAALPAEQASAPGQAKGLDTPRRAPPGCCRRLSSTSQHHGSPESQRREETDEQRCRAALPDKADLKRLASKAASVGELASPQQSEPGSGTARWPEGLGGSVPVLPGSEAQATGLGKGCPVQWAPSPVAEGNSPHAVVRTTTPLHVAHVTEQDSSSRKQVALPLLETGRPLPTTALPPPLTLDPEEVEAPKSFQKPLNALKAPRPALSPKPKFPPQVAKSRSENSFLSGSAPLAKLPKSVTF